MLSLLQCFVSQAREPPSACFSSSSPSSRRLLSPAPDPCRRPAAPPKVAAALAGVQQPPPCPVLPPLPSSVLPCFGAVSATSRHHCCRPLLPPTPVATICRRPPPMPSPTVADHHRPPSQPPLLFSTLPNHHCWRYKTSYPLLNLFMFNGTKINNFNIMFC